MVAPGAGTPTGTVQFFVDGVATGNPVAVDASGVAVSGGIATVHAGTHSITAIYLGDIDFATRHPTAVDQVVAQAPTAFTISVNGSSSATIPYGRRRRSPTSGLPAGATGTVTFSSPNANLCTITLPATSCQTSATLAVGDHRPDQRDVHRPRRQLHRIGVVEHGDVDGRRTRSRVNGGCRARDLARRAVAVKVTWTAPVNDGGTAITGYTVTASPGGKTVAVSGSAHAGTSSPVSPSGQLHASGCVRQHAGTGVLSVASNVSDHRWTHIVRDTGCSAAGARSRLRKLRPTSATPSGNGGRHGRPP